MIGLVLQAKYVNSYWLSPRGGGCSVVDAVYAAFIEGMVSAPVRSERGCTFSLICLRKKVWFSRKIGRPYFAFCMLLSVTSCMGLISAFPTCRCSSDITHAMSSKTDVILSLQPRGNVA